MSRRRQAYRELSTIFIFCEGDRTEPNYFSMFHPKQTSVMINPGKPRNAGGEAKGLRALAEGFLRSGSYRQGRDRIWIVLDKDRNPREDLTALREWCSSNGVGLAFSNPCFEYWLLIHYEYVESGENKEHLRSMLSRRLGGYEKSADYASALRERVPTAIRNARTLRGGLDPKGYCDHNPFTSVDVLASELRGLEENSQGSSFHSLTEH